MPAWGAMVHMLDIKHEKFHLNNKCLEYGRFYFYFSYGAVNKERMHEGETKTLNHSKYIVQHVFIVLNGIFD